MQKNSTFLAVASACLAATVWWNPAFGVQYQHTFTR